MNDSPLKTHLLRHHVRRILLSSDEEEFTPGRSDKACTPSACAARPISSSLTNPSATKREAVDKVDRRHQGTDMQEAATGDSAHACRCPVVCGNAADEHQVNSLQLVQNPETAPSPVATRHYVQENSDPPLQSPLNQGTPEDLGIVIDMTHAEEMVWNSQEDGNDSDTNSSTSTPAFKRGEHALLWDTSSKHDNKEAICLLKMEGSQFSLSGGGRNPSVLILANAMLCHWPKK